jgi:4-aminobutyrate aminotransferase-like enzyme
MDNDTPKSLLDRRIRVLGRNSYFFYDRPVHFVRGEGVWLYDSEGRPYLDAYNNVPHVGHSHPRVVEALSHQARLLNTHSRYLDTTIVDYAEQLLATFSSSPLNVLFCCSGSEANELAIRMARECTGNAGVIATACAYHGNTAAVTEVSSVLNPTPSPFVRFVPVIDSYRDDGACGDGQLAETYASHIETAIEDFARHDIKVAGFLFCTAFSCEGLPTVPRGYLQKAHRLIHEAGGLLIADEVQGGFGRFGSHMWGHAMHGVIPDIVTLGKPMGGGYPMAGVIARTDLVDKFTQRVMYFNTTAGSPVAAAVGRAVLEVLRDENLLENATTVGEYLRRRLRDLQGTHSLIGDVRGRGHFTAVELVKDRRTKEPASLQTRRVLNAMRECGVLVGSNGAAFNVLKVRPPMPFSRDNADLFVDTLDHVLATLQ